VIDADKGALVEDAEIGLEDQLQKEQLPEARRLVEEGLGHHLASVKRRVSAEAAEDNAREVGESLGIGGLEKNIRLDIRNQKAFVDQ
jgi:hypothetical protein